MSHRFNRRGALAAFGSVSLGALIAACGGEGDSTTNVSTTDGSTTTVEPKTSSRAATSELFDDSSSCTLAVQQTEGPYYFDADSIRSDIREGHDGTRLRLAIRVRDAESCEPLKNAVVDVWHCDALGVYSGFEAASTGAGGGGAGGEGPTDKEKYLRGAQVTNSDGIVEFVTIYPGWYRGRTVHIHAKVHVDNQSALTTQFYFDEDVTERVYTRRPYSEHSGRDQFNDSDGIFDESLLLDLSKEGDGYVGAISLDVQSA
jgi:protocatechuate 3,4-dioxygenase beta subunit